MTIMSFGVYDLSNARLRTRYFDQMSDRQEKSNRTYIYRNTSILK